MSCLRYEAAYKNLIKKYDNKYDRQNQQIIGNA